MSSQPDPEIGPHALETDAQGRWDALKDAVAELAGAVGDPEGFSGAFAALTQVGQGIDLQEVLNAVHVPDDAGEHADALRRMLLRIPDGWGRWIGCSRGWYPILVDLDGQLRTLFPAYELQQVKEKYGGLRFYWSEGERVLDPNDSEPETPDLDANAPTADKEAAWRAWEEAHDAWSARVQRYRATGAGAARTEVFDRRLELAEQLVSAAEQRASVTCELCGQPGHSSHTRGPSPWYQTLCPTCAQAHGYERSRRHQP